MTEVVTSGNPVQTEVKGHSSQCNTQVCTCWVSVQVQQSADWETKHPGSYFESPVHNSCQLCFARHIFRCQVLKEVAGRSGVKNLRGRKMMKEVKKKSQILKILKIFQIKQFKTENWYLLQLLTTHTVICPGVMSRFCCIWYVTDTGAM